MHDALYVLNHLCRWCVAFHTQSRFGSFDRAGCEIQFHAARGLANIGRAKIEGFSSDVHVDAIQIFAADNFNARDVSASRWNELLHERGIVESERKLSVAGCLL